MPGKSEDLSYKQRCQIKALHDTAKWSLKYVQWVREREQVLIEVGRQISIAQNIPIRTVHRVSYLRATPQKFQCGRKMISNTPTRKYLVSLTTHDAYHRRLAYSVVAKIVGVQACEETLHAAFAPQG
jgi:hypothetical protein